jgi:hypothetical protein
MIGHIAQAYRDGRRDAASGRRRPRDPWRESANLRVFYVLGWKDERARMRLEGRLPQLEMSLPDGMGSESRNGTPQIAQERRSHVRMTPSTPEID